VRREGAAAGAVANSSAGTPAAGGAVLPQQLGTLHLSLGAVNRGMGRLGWVAEHACGDFH